AVENRVPLQHEMQAAKQCPDTMWDARFSWGTGQHMDVHFPFVLTCLILGASFDPDQGYEHGVSIEPFNMSYDAGDNNNGITIVDITQLDNVRYCFVDFYGMESEREVPLNTPLSARTYLEAYYGSEKWSNEYNEKLEGLQSFGLINVGALHETWPAGEWSGISNVEQDHSTNLEVSRLSARSLADTSLDILIDNALGAQHVDDLSWMQEAELVREFIPALRSRLYQRPTIAGSAVVTRLLGRVLHGVSQVDLSPFIQLSSNDMFTIITSLPDKHLLTLLDLSNMRITGPVLGKILGLLPNIRRLYIMNTTNLTWESALSALNCPDIRDVYHTELIRNAIPGEEKHAIVRDALQTWGASNNPIVQLLWVQGEVSVISREATCLHDGGIDWSSLSAVPGAFPLTGTFMPPVKLVTGLTQLLNYATSGDRYISAWTGGCPDDIGRAAAYSFALASSHVPDGPSFQVGSLFSVLGSKSQGYSGQPPTPLLDMCSGQWTVIIIQEYSIREKHTGPKPRLRYAFLTPTEQDTQESNQRSFWSAGDFLVADINLFLQRAMRGKVEPGLKGYWDQQMEALKSRLEKCGGPAPEESSKDLVRFSSREEVLSLLRCFPES
ncbi:MAG: hypothetical protein M1835_007231, partial [Candelina submexicana]